jgi:hypothetical protein
MEKLYYPISGGEVPSIIDRPGRTIEQIKKEENTLMSLVNLKRIKDKITNYLEANGISYTQVVVAPSLDLLISENDVKTFPTDPSKAGYNWGYRLDIVPNYVSADLSCVVYINGEDEEFIDQPILEELGIDLTPMIVNYNVFVNFLSKQGIGTHKIPATFGEYKKIFIDEEVEEQLGYNLCTDIIISEKEKNKKVL